MSSRMGDPGLDDAGIGKQPRERPAEGREVQADQHHKFRTGKLNERGRVTFAFLEGRAGFGIEPEERFLFEKIQGTAISPSVWTSITSPSVGPTWAGR